MSYTLYDYVDIHGDNAIKEWTLALQPPDRTKFNVKLNMLRTAGSDLPPKLLSDTRSPHIKKLRFFGQGQKQLRPMLCKGPVNSNIEFTLLLGAEEKGSKLNPIDADHRAEILRQQIIANPNARRRLHEH